MKDLDFKNLLEKMDELASYLVRLNKEEIKNGKKTLELFSLWTEPPTGDGVAEFEDFYKTIKNSAVKQWCELNCEENSKLEIDIAKALNVVSIIDCYMQDIKSIIGD